MVGPAIAPVAATAPIWGPAAVTAGAAVVGGLINLWSAQKGLKAGREEARRAERTQIELFEKQTKEERRSAGKRMKFESEERQKDRGYKNYQSFMDRMVGTMNAKPKLAANLIELQKARL